MIAAERFRVRVDAKHEGMRLDQYLAACVPDLSRRKARVLLEIGGVFVDRSRVKVAGRKVKSGQLVEVVLGGAFDRATKKTGSVARDIDAAKLPQPTLLFEDEDILVVAKPAGLLSAPTPESDRGNLADLLGRERSVRLYVVHRLDLDTSGILVFAKSEHANEVLSQIFREHKIERQYLAVLLGMWPEEIERVEMDVGDKRAVSHFHVVERLSDRATVVHVNLETGRTHQIRLHATGTGYPVLGDKQHGQVSDLTPPRMALHARLLAFAHPTSGEPLRFEIDLPPDLQSWLDELKSSF